VCRPDFQLDGAETEKTCEEKLLEMCVGVAVANVEKVSTRFTCCSVFGALTLLVEHQEEHPSCKN